MTNILITRAVEQIFMIGVAVGLVLLGAYVAGAVVGTAVGFFASMICAIILFRKEIAKSFHTLAIDFHELNGSLRYENR